MERGCLWREGEREDGREEGRDGRRGEGGAVRRVRQGGIGRQGGIEGGSNICQS